MKTKSKIIAILLFIVITIFPSVVNASDTRTEAQVKAGNTLAQFAINFYNSYHEQVKYSLNGACTSSEGDRGAAYRGQQVGGLYKFDCVGWISFAVHHSLKMGNSNFSYFAVPPGGSNNARFTNGFTCISGNATSQSGTPDLSLLKPGDILFTAKGSPHVVLYVGNGKIIHCSNGLEYSDLSTRYNRYCAIGRITPEAAEALNFDGVTTVFNEVTGAADAIFYDGVAEGQYVGKSKSFFEWVLDSLKAALDWLIGISTLGIKLAIIGWTTIFENLVTGLVEKISGEDIIQTRITIEDVLYNKIPILDINIFNFSTAGGQALEGDSIVYTIRENIAMWYYIFRNITIIGLLITLIYIGIRMAISTVAEQKSKYKSMLLNWFVSFIILFFIHYFMIAVININQGIIDIFSKVAPETTVEVDGEIVTTKEASLYESIKSKAYDIRALSGWSGTIIYMVLVYFLVKYLFVYFKRYLVINILAMMAPLIAISYSIDKIKDNKSQAFSNWMKDFSFNVLIQSVHVILYSIFVYIAFDMATQSLGGMIIAFVFLNMMLKSESIIRKIFGMKSKSLDNTLDAMASAAASYAAVTGLAKGAYSNIAKPIAGKISNSKLGENIRQAYQDYRISSADYRETYGESNEKEINSNLDKQIENLRKEEAEARKKYAMESLEFGKNAIGGLTKTVASIPMLIVDPGYGFAMGTSGVTSLNKAFGKKKNIYGYRKNYNKNTKNKKYKGLRIALAIGTAGISSGIENRIDEDKHKTDKIKTDYPKKSRILVEARNLEGDIVEQVQELKQNDNIMFKLESSTASPLERQLSKMKNEEFDNAVKQALIEIPEEKIEEIVSKYLLDNNKTHIEISDIFNITREINNDTKVRKIFSKANSSVRIEVTHELEKNIKQGLEKAIIEKAFGIANEYKTVNIDENLTRTIQQNINNPVVNVNNPAANINNPANNAANIRTIVNDNVKNQVIKKLDLKDTTRIISNALNRPDTIRKDPIPIEFAGIMDNVQKLKDINSEYRKISGKNIYNIEKTINNIKNRYIYEA